MRGRADSIAPNRRPAVTSANDASLTTATISTAATAGAASPAVIATATGPADVPHGYANAGGRWRE